MDHLLFFLEICEQEILFYSTPSQIVSNYSVSIPSTDSILGYDKYNRQLLYYNDTKNLYRASLNGRDSEIVIYKPSLTDFAFDGKNGVLYYINEFTLKINSVNISSGEDTPIEALRSLSGIKDLEMDVKNG